MKADVEHQERRFSFLLHERDYISSVLTNGRRFFEPEILEFVRQNFPVQKTIVDVGANIGNHAVFFANFLEYESLVCFEPFPPNFALLTENLRANASNEKVRLYDCGLGEREKTVGMRFHPENLGICRLDDAIPGSISVRTLDSFDLKDVTLIKVDVEGDDVAVLLGARETLRRFRPTLLIEGGFDSLFPLLAPLGYVCVAYWKPYQTYCFSRLLKGIE